MKLPNSENALVEREKIADYLLNASHPDNGGKARFFKQLGFRQDEWMILAKALLSLTATATVAQSLKSPHGQKYVIIGRIESPSGRSPMVRAIWIMDNGSKAARLVTAYPHEE